MLTHKIVTMMKFNATEIIIFLLPLFCMLFKISRIEFVFYIYIIYIYEQYVHVRPPQTYSLYMYRIFADPEFFPTRGGGGEGVREIT